jgi:NADH-quinone oxidoreductase subunit M
VLLKMGGYGILRIAFPLCPYGTQVCAYGIVALGVFSIIYGAFAAMAQTDFKRLVAYSSVSHMGYVLLGLGVWKISEAANAAYYWQMGVAAAMFQMIAHGVSSAGMFFMVGVLYDRVHHRDLNRFGGIAGLMPHYTGLAAGIFFAGLGLPGLCGFIGEAFSVLSAWQYDRLLAVIAAAGVILTAGYILWTIQRVYFGPTYNGPHPEALTQMPMTNREACIAYVLLAFAIVLGVLPNLLIDTMNPTIEAFVSHMNEGFRATPMTSSADVSLLP